MAQRTGLVSGRHLRFFVACMSIATASEMNISSQTGLIEYLVRDYDRIVPPGLYQAPAKVEISYSMEHLYGINQQRGSFWVDMVWRLHWHDHRLAWDEFKSSLKNPPGRMGLRLDAFQDRIWLPDLYFVNVIKREQSPTPDANSFLGLQPNGNLIWSRKFILELRCTMDFRYFPFDDQTCFIETSFYGTDLEDATLAFKDTAGDKTLEDVKLSEWQNFAESRIVQSVSFSTASFAEAKVKFTFSRIASGWIKLSILPPILFVCISYAGFWIDQGAAPARIALSVICVLIVVSNLVAVRSIMPIVSYQVWLMVFLFGCLCFNTASLFSYAIVNFAKTQIGKMKDDDETRRSVLLRKVLTWFVHLDVHMRWIFPLCFLVFVIVAFTDRG